MGKTEMRSDKVFGRNNNAALHPTSFLQISLASIPREKKKKVYKTPLFELLVVPFHEITVWVFFPLKDNGRIMVVFI